MTAAPQLALVARSTEEWISATEVMIRTGWSERTLFRRAPELVSREANRIAANGRRVREYLASSLPQSAIVVTGRGPAQVKTLAPLGPLFANLPIQSSYPVVLSDPEAQAQAAERMAILQPLLDYAAESRSLALLRLRDGRNVTSQARLIEWICEQHNVTPRTIKRWKARFAEGGFAALADRGRSDRGNSRWMQRDDRNLQLAEIAVYAHLQENLSKRMAWEIACGQAKQIGIEPPSYETVRNLLENVPAPIKTLALKGRRKYDEIFAPYIRRGYTDFEAGEILVSDHALHDVLVQNDLFDAKDRQHMRLRFTGLLDMRSRKFVGYAWSQEGSSRSITTCFRHAVQRFGAPRLLYCDNGKDYQKVGRGARGGVWDVQDLSPETLGVIARLGIDIQYCRPFHPQAKLIERANNTLHQRFDRRFLTYTGPTPEQRPDRCIAALEQHKKLLTAGRPDDSLLPLASEFIRAAIAWIEGEYHQKEKDVEGMANLTPNDAFEKHRWADRPAPPSPQDLAPLLADRIRCKVNECTVTLNKHRYEATDDMGNRMMHYHTGKFILVAFDPLDPDAAIALDDDGRVIAYLRPEQLLRQSNDEETRAAIAASFEQRGRRAKETRESLTGLSRRVRATGYTSQHEHMLAIGRLPIEIDDVVVHRPQKARLVESQPQPNLVPGDAADRLAARLRRQSEHSE